MCQTREQTLSVKINSSAKSIPRQTRGALRNFPSRRHRNDTSLWLVNSACHGQFQEKEKNTDHWIEYFPFEKILRKLVTGLQCFRLLIAPLPVKFDWRDGYCSNLCEEYHIYEREWLFPLPTKYNRKLHWTVKSVWRSIKCKMWKIWLNQCPVGMLQIGKQRRWKRAPYRVVLWKSSLVQNNRIAVHKLSPYPEKCLVIRNIDSSELKKTRGENGSVLSEGCLWPGEKFRSTYIRMAALKKVINFSQI